MSYDKNSNNFSSILTTINVLNGLGVEYKVEVIGKVRGLGVNDDYLNIAEYSLYRLEYQGKVFLDRMHRTNDCDSDDNILTHEFNNESEPKEWHLEVFEDYRDFLEPIDDFTEELNITDFKPSSYYGKKIWSKS